MILQVFATIYFASLASALSADLGLNNNNLHKNGISIGFLPAWGEPKSPNNASYLNSLIPEPMSIVGAYVQIRPDTDPTFSQLDFFLQDILSLQGDLPVLNLALMPSEGLASITQDVANSIAAKMAEVNSRGLTIWLRYAHEMNGEWYAWGQQPEAFVASFNMVSQAVKNATQETYMLWAPNEMYAGDNQTSNYRGGYDPYWPGADNVDLVGLSFYQYGGFDRLNVLPPDGMAFNVINRFDILYGSGQNKSIVLAETGAAYTTLLETGEPGPGGQTDDAIKFAWLWQLTEPAISERIPAYRALTWFEVMKDENASGDSIVKEEDFRLITGSPTVAQGAIDYIEQASIVTQRPMPAFAAATTSTSVAQSTESARSSAVTNLTNLHMSFFLAVMTVLGLWSL